MKFKPMWILIGILAISQMPSEQLSKVLAFLIIGAVAFVAVKVYKYAKRTQNEEGSNNATEGQSVS